MSMKFLLIKIFIFYKKQRRACCSHALLCEISCQLWGTWKLPAPHDHPCPSLNFWLWAEFRLSHFRTSQYQAIWPRDYRVPNHQCWWASESRGHWFWSSCSTSFVFTSWLLANFLFDIIPHFHNYFKLCIHIVLFSIQKATKTILLLFFILIYIFSTFRSFHYPFHDCFRIHMILVLEHLLLNFLL